MATGSQARQAFAMALMYPPTLADAHGPRGERAVFDALARELADDFYCYHSKELFVVVGGRGAALQGPRG